jgi:hypothetical protein
VIELACQISRTARAGTARARRAGLPRQSPARGAPDPAPLDELIGELDHQLARAGVCGKADPGQDSTRRQRSTRRRQDAPGLPRKKISPRTTGKVYAAPDGKTYRPSMFLTLTCGSYRLMDALRFEPCSPSCANWLRYGIQPKDAREGMRPGACKGKAHRAEHLGYAGRRVLVSRKWSGKTLADHRGDRKAWLLSMLGLPEPDNDGRYRWEIVTPADTDFMPLGRRMLHILADRARWQAALAEARRKAQEAIDDLPPIGRAA